MSVSFEVTLLGVNSALPVYGRHPSSQIVEHDGQLFMVDCGEGTQVQLGTYNIKRSKIEHVFISHMHGDHCFGLPGFLTTSSLQQRIKPLTLHGPVGLERFVRTALDVSGSHVGYELIINEYDTEKVNHIVVNDDLTVHTFPLKHRVPTMGFRFQENIQKVNIISEQIRKLQLSIEEIKRAKAGEDIVRENAIISNNQVAITKYLNRSYAYVSDTVYDLDIISHIKNVSVLYHETTYLDDLKHLADERMHTTLGGAIDIANRANVGKLITGHYSSRYSDTSIFLKCGRQLWDRVQLGVEGGKYNV